MKQFLVSGMLMFPTSFATAQTAKVTSLISRHLFDLPGREGTLLSVEYPPGGTDPVHRHDAHVFVYILEGSVVMQVKGSTPVTLGPGQTFYEGPSDIHLISRNASTTKPARFLAFFVKTTGAAAILPVP
jgi:quercetin dioxygenase-like cupin family protein